MITSPQEESTDCEYMRIALALARDAFNSGETPVGAVIVSRDGRIIGKGRNNRELTGDITAHAEIEALRSAAANVGSWRIPEATLYVTLEPCPMCASAIIQARLSRVVFGACDTVGGAVSGILNLFVEYGTHINVTGGVLSRECGALLSDFFSKMRKNALDVNGT